MTKHTKRNLDACSRISARKAEGTHLAPEYTANGPAIGGPSGEWPTSDKFLAYMRRHNHPRFENITAAESRRVLLRVVK